MYLGVAQLVARYLGVVEAASSSLVTQTKNGDVSIVWTAPFFFFVSLQLKSQPILKRDRLIGKSIPHLPFTEII